MRSFNNIAFLTNQAKTLGLETLSADPTSPTTGQMWFNTSTGYPKVKLPSRVMAISDQYWGLTGNAGTTASTNFIGTTDAVNFRIRTNNVDQIEVTTNGVFKLGSVDATGILGSERIAVNDATGGYSDFCFAVAGGGYPSFVFGASAGTPTARTATTAGNNLGNMVWYAYDGSSWVQAIEHVAVLDTISSGKTTAHMDVKVGSAKTVVMSYSDVGVSLLGSPTAPTQASTDSSTKLATTAFVANQVKQRIQTPFSLCHFENLLVGSTLTSSVSGTSAAVTASTGSMLHPGVIQFSTGTTATGYASVATNLSSFFFSGGGGFEFETQIQIPTLSTSSQTYIFRAGALDSVSGDAVDGVYFEYDQTSSTYWRFCTASNSTRTKTATTITVSAATWYTLNIKVNSAGNLATFSINGNVVGTISTNIPAASGREVGVGLSLVKSKGNTASTLLSDYIYYQLNNPNI